MRKKLSKSGGFTIVELLVSIVVIAILAAISVVAYTGIQERARRSAHQQEASQAERQIMMHAAIEGGSANDIGGKLVGYLEGAGVRRLINPLAGTPDITMYVVCSVGSTAASYQTISQLSPWNNAYQTFLLQVGLGGFDRMGYRIDTSSQLNASGDVDGIRVPGDVIIGWLQVSNNLTQRSSGWNQAAHHNSNSLNPGGGWNFRDLSVVDQDSCTPHATLVFGAAHDQSTRAVVIEWLAEKYNISL